MPDANHLLDYLLGYYPDSVNTTYDMTLKAFNVDVSNTFKHFKYMSYVLEGLMQDHTQF